MQSVNVRTRLKYTKHGEALATFFSVDRPVVVIGADAETSDGVFIHEEIVVQTERDKR